MSFMHHASLERIPVEALTPYAGNARTHSKGQIKQITKSIERFGFTNPVLIDDSNGIIAGHGRILAAKAIGMTDVPCLRLKDLSDADKRAYILADNKLALNAGWDKDLLAIELQGLIDFKYDLDLTGFSICEVDTVIGEARDAGVNGSDGNENEIPEPAATAVTRPGDVWQLGRHRLICGDAQDATAYTYQGQPLPLIVMLHGCTQSADDFAAGRRKQRCRPKFVPSFSRSRNCRIPFD